MGPGSRTSSRSKVRRDPDELLGEYVTFRVHLSGFESHIVQSVSRKKVCVSEQITCRLHLLRFSQKLKGHVVYVAYGLHWIGKQGMCSTRVFNEVQMFCWNRSIQDVILLVYAGGRA